MFSILDRYIGKTILNTIGITLFLLVSLSGIIRFIEQLRRLKADYDALNAAFFSLLMIPKDLEVFTPIAALLGALIGLGMLASKSELVVMETSGFNRLQIAKSVIKTAIPLILLVMAIGEWVAPISEQAARNIRSEKLYGGSLIVSKNGIWAKDGKDYVYIGQVKSTTELTNVNIFTVDNNKLISITHAAVATFVDDHWQLLQVEMNDLTNQAQIQGNNLLSKTWESSISPDKLNIVSQDPRSLSAFGLYKYAQYLQSSAQDDSYYRLLFWQKVLKPISVAVMMLLALSFIFGPLRSVSTGVRIVTGITFGFIFYIADNLFSQISIVVGLPPIIGALLTSLTFLAISFYLLKKRR